MDYKRGLDQIRLRAAGTRWLSDFLVSEQRMLDNLERERKFGTQESLRSERAQIADELNSLALREIGIDFNRLCQAPPPAPAASDWVEEQAALRLPVIVSAIVGVLRLTFTNDGGGLSLRAANIGDHELTEVHITLRPPPQVFLSNPVVRFPRLPAQASKDANALTLFAVASFDLPFSVSYRNAHAAIERFDTRVRIPES